MVWELCLSYDLRSGGYETGNGDAADATPPDVQCRKRGNNPQTALFPAAAGHSVFCTVALPRMGEEVLKRAQHYNPRWNTTN